MVRSRMIATAREGLLRTRWSSRLAGITMSVTAAAATAAAERGALPNSPTTHESESVGAI